jgi:hypothetical protein
MESVSKTHSLNDKQSDLKIQEIPIESIKIDDLLAQKKAERSLQKIKTAKVGEGGMFFVENGLDKYIAIFKNVVDCLGFVIEFKTGVLYFHKVRTSSAADIKYRFHSLFQKHSLKLEDLKKIIFFGGYHNDQYTVLKTDKIDVIKNSVRSVTDVNELSEVIQQKLEQGKKKNYKYEPGMVTLGRTTRSSVNLPQNVEMVVSDDEGGEVEYKIQGVNIKNRNIGTQIFLIVLKSLVSAFVGDVKLGDFDRAKNKKDVFDSICKVNRRWFEIEPASNVYVDLENDKFNVVKLPSRYTFDYDISHLDKKIPKKTFDIFSEDEDLYNTGYSRVTGAYSLYKKEKSPEKSVKVKKTKKPENTLKSETMKKKKV